MVLIIESVLNPQLNETNSITAHVQGFGLLASYAPQGGGGTYRGGTLILYALDDIKLINTITTLPHLTRGTFEYLGEEYEIASVYAPQPVLSRMEFFTAIHKHLSDSTIVGGRLEL